jgi:sporulation protein YlmC with PRC-barrel domain
MTTPEETTPLPLGWPILGSDGPLGRLTDVVVEPRERRVTHLVMEDRAGDARLVPAELLVQGRSGGKVVTLSCSSADAATFAAIRSFSVVGITEFPAGDEGTDVGVEDMVVIPGIGVTGFGDLGGDLGSFGVTYDRIPAGSAELRRESTVVSADGKELGNLDGFLVAGDRLTHVVLQRTHPSDKGAAAIPVESVSAIETDRITVTLPEEIAESFEGGRSHWLPFI